LNPRGGIGDFGQLVSSSYTASDVGEITIEIDWGDGSESGQRPTLVDHLIVASHNYSANGVFTITARGEFGAFSSNTITALIGQ